jgi:hypothetical protein
MNPMFGGKGQSEPRQPNTVVVRHTRRKQARQERISTPVLPRFIEQSGPESKANAADGEERIKQQ